MHLLTSAGGSADLFVSKLGPEGNLRSARHAGGIHNEFGYSIDVNTAGNISIVGPFSGTADFDPSAGTYPITAAGSIDMFSLRLTPCLTGSTHTVTACDSFTWIDGMTYTESSSPSIFLASKSGCDSLVSLHLTINTVDPTLTTTPTEISANAVGASYQWYDCISGEEVENATNQGFSPSTSGLYKVKIWIDGCEAESICESMIITGSDQETRSNIQLYPNPTAGTITLHIPENLKCTGLRLRNAHGQTLSERAIENTHSVILEIRGSAGLYVVELETMAGRTFFMKVLKN